MFRSAWMMAVRFAGIGLSRPSSVAGVASEELITGRRGDEEMEDSTKLPTAASLFHPVVHAVAPGPPAPAGRLAMKKVRDATAQILDHTTLADINAQIARRRRTPVRGQGREK